MKLGLRNCGADEAFDGGTGDIMLCAYYDDGRRVATGNLIRITRSGELRRIGSVDSELEGLLALDDHGRVVFDDLV